MEEQKSFRGILPMLYSISEEEIEAVIRRWRDANPLDERTDEELRPLAVNYSITVKTP